MLELSYHNKDKITAKYRKGVILEILKLKPLIHGQINLIKFIESNKFDNVYSQIWHIFVWSYQFDQILKK